MWGLGGPDRFFRRSRSRSRNTRIHICCLMAGQARAAPVPVSPLCNSDRTKGWHSANEIGQWDQPEEAQVGGAWNQRSEDQTEFVPWLDLTQSESRGQDEKDLGFVPPRHRVFCEPIVLSDVDLQAGLLMRRGELIRRSNSFSLAIDNLCFLFTISLAQ